jgi:electron transport complex protein RnfC
MRTDHSALAQQAGKTLHRFHGGLRLRHNKKISCQRPVEPCPLPTRLCLPLLQHLGAAATALVSPGEQVLAGQLIGRAGETGACVHAPTSGRIESVEELAMAHPSGLPGPCIIIRPDGQDRWFPAEQTEDWKTAKPADLRARIRSGGIVGLGGAVFPTGRKADAAAGSGIHTLVINGAECEPYISCDEMLMREHPARIVLGSIMLQRAVDADQVIIAIEDQMGAVGTALKAAVREQGATGMRIIHIPTIYPEGGEKQLIQVLTGLEVPDGELPQALGMLCQNVATAAAVADLLEDGRPLVDRYVTVTGNGVVEPRNLRALLGTPIVDLVAACGGYTDDAARLVIGGPMMGYALASDREPVVKATNCVLVLEESDITRPQEEMPCIRCGECARVCPAQLMPQELHFRVRAGQLDEAVEWGLSACIECGCCDLVCPSHIPLVGWFRHGKGAWRRQSEERVSSDQARQRFEAREARLALAKTEKSERLARRKRDLKDKASREAQVAASIARAGRSRNNGGDR